MSDEITAAEKLSGDALRDFLRKLKLQDPDLGDTVEAYVQRTTELGGFLQTASPWASEEAAPEIPSGTRIGNWRVVERLGEGGMGAGSSIAAMIFTGPPQASQVSMSMAKTRRRRWAQLMARRR